MPVPAATLDRIVRSRNVLVTAKLAGSLGGRPEDTRRMIGEEIAILEQHIAEHPEHAGSWGELVREWRGLLPRVH